jgi:hypothetical protein
METYFAGQFWARARGNFLISGGTLPTRSLVICDKLCCELERGEKPTFLLTTSDLTEREMIRRITEGKTGGRLCVTSKRYPNYLFFNGWSESDIARFLVAAAAALHFENPMMPVYIAAFTHVLSRYYIPGLSSMCALAKHTDDEIAEIGESGGADPIKVGHLRSYAKEGQLFRLLLSQMENVFSPLAAAEPEKGYNLATNRSENDGLYLINVSSHSQALMNMYFAEELAIAMERERARIVLEGMSFAEDDKLYEVFVHLLECGTEFGISSLDPAALLGEKLRSFHSMAVLLEDGMPEGALRQLLEPLGTYTHYVAVLGDVAPPRLVPLIHSKSWTIHPEPNYLRVMPHEARGFAAALYGMKDNEIYLVRNLL